MIDVEYITCTHYCTLFTVDLVFSATCDEMSVLRAMIVTSQGFQRRTILHNVGISDIVSK